MFEFGEDQLEEEAALVSASITDEQLAVLTGSHNLATTEYLQMTVDSAHVPLGTLGERLPALEQLKLSGSCLPSIRELGTSLTKLRVIWLCRCGLGELDGLSALPQLQELYLSFNDIAALSPLTSLEELQVLDLEANSVAAMAEVEWLQLMPSLQELTLHGNPVCDSEPALRSKLVQMLPGLQMLDDELLSGAHGAADQASEPTEPLSRPQTADHGRVYDRHASAVNVRGGAPPVAEGGSASGVEGAAWRRLSDTADHECAAAASPARSAASAAVAGEAAAAAGGAAGASTDEIERRRQRELRLVTEAIKHVPVPRIFDVAADGRATFGGFSDSAACARPLTAVSSMSSFDGNSRRPSTASGWPQRRTAWDSGVGSRLDSGVASPRMSACRSSCHSAGQSSCERLGSGSSAATRGGGGSGGSGRPGSSASGGGAARPSTGYLRPPTGASRGGLSSSYGGRPATGYAISAGVPQSSVAEIGGDDETGASELTMGGDIICGIGALRRHRLTRSVSDLRVREEKAAGGGVPGARRGARRMAALSSMWIRRCSTSCARSRCSSSSQASIPMNAARRATAPTAAPTARAAPTTRAAPTARAARRRRRVTLCRGRASPTDT